MSRSHLVDPDSIPSSVASILFLRKPSSHSNDDIVASLFLSLFKFYLWLMKLAMGTQNSVSSHGSMRIDDKEVPWVGSSKPNFFSSYCPIPFNYSHTNNVHRNSVYTHTIYDTFIYYLSCSGLFFWADWTCWRRIVWSSFAPMSPQRRWSLWEWVVYKSSELRFMEYKWFLLMPQVLRIFVIVPMIRTWNLRLCLLTMIYVSRTSHTLLEVPAISSFHRLSCSWRADSGCHSVSSNSTGILIIPIHPHCWNIEKTREIRKKKHRTTVYKFEF
jgi:hypothetical protein